MLKFSLSRENVKRPTLLLNFETKTGEGISHVTIVNISYLVFQICWSVSFWKLVMLPLFIPPLVVFTIVY